MVSLKRLKYKISPIKSATMTEQNIVNVASKILYSLLQTPSNQIALDPLSAAFGNTITFDYEDTIKSINHVEYNTTSYSTPIDITQPFTFPFSSVAELLKFLHIFDVGLIEESNFARFDFGRGGVETSANNLYSLLGWEGDPLNLNGSDVIYDEETVLVNALSLNFSLYSPLSVSGDTGTDSFTFINIDNNLDATPFSWDLNGIIAGEWSAYSTVLSGNSMDLSGGSGVIVFKLTATPSNPTFPPLICVLNVNRNM